jgi:hypothetical protein
MPIFVPRVDDFEITGKGDAGAWAGATWLDLGRVGEGSEEYRTRAKALYSATGIHFLVECEDRVLTCTIEEDFADLFREDVIEVFLQPDETQRLYFEYEISPLGYELPVMVANSGTGPFMGWLPWHYEGERAVRRAVSVRGGRALSMAECEGWTVEFMIPFALLRGCGNVPPDPASRWRGNVYRIDYDRRPQTQWALCPATGGAFHDYWNFGEFVFE